jgi:alpha/beta superfamily hydrolase
VGLEVGIDDDRVAQLISIGTPVNQYDFSFVTACRKPILFVHGEHDEYGDVKRLRELVALVSVNAAAELRVINGAGHFFDNQLDEVKRVISEWMTGHHSSPDSQ